MKEECGVRRVVHRGQRLWSNSKSKGQSGDASMQYYLRYKTLMYHNRRVGESFNMRISLFGDYHFLHAVEKIATVCHLHIHSSITAPCVRVCSGPNRFYLLTRKALFATHYTFRTDWKSCQTPIFDPSTLSMPTSWPLGIISYTLLGFSSRETYRFLSQALPYGPRLKMKWQLWLGQVAVSDLKQHANWFFIMAWL